MMCQNEICVKTEQRDFILFETITLIRYVATNWYIKFDNSKVSADLLKTKKNHEYCPIFKGNLTRGDTANQELSHMYQRGRRPL